MRVDKIFAETTGTRFTFRIGCGITPFIGQVQAACTVVECLVPAHKALQVGVLVRLGIRWQWDAIVVDWAASNSGLYKLHRVFLGTARVFNWLGRR